MEDPYPLAANSNMSFNGCAVCWRIGFTFDDRRISQGKNYNCGNEIIDKRPTLRNARAYLSVYRWR